MAFNKRAFTGFNRRGEYCLDSEWSRINARFYGALGQRAEALGVVKRDAQRLLDLDPRNSARICLALYQTTDHYAESRAANPEYLPSESWFEKVSRIEALPLVW